MATCLSLSFRVSTHCETSSIYHSIDHCFEMPYAGMLEKRETVTDKSQRGIAFSIFALDPVILPRTKLTITTRDPDADASVSSGSSTKPQCRWCHSSARASACGGRRRRRGLVGASSQLNPAPAAACTPPWPTTTILRRPTTLSRRRGRQRSPRRRRPRPPSLPASCHSPISARARRTRPRTLWATSCSSNTFASTGRVSGGGSGAPATRRATRTGGDCTTSAVHHSWFEP